MGQGRLNPTCCRSILLIAMAIQGLTPDLHDLASSTVLYLVGPNLVKGSAFHLEDESPDDVCELVRPTQIQERFREADDLGPARLVIVQGFQVTVWFPTTRPSFDGRVAGHTLPLIEHLCRLTC